MKYGIEIDKLKTMVLLTFMAFSFRAVGSVLKLQEKRGWKVEAVDLYFTSGRINLLFKDGRLWAVDGRGYRLFSLPYKFFTYKKGKLFSLTPSSLLVYSPSGLEEYYPFEKPIPLVPGFSWDVVWGKKKLLFYQLAHIYKKKNNLPRKIYALLEKNGIFREVYVKKTGFSPSKFFLSPWGLLFLSPQILNGISYKGFSDLMGAIGLVNFKGTLISHLDFFGYYVYPALYKRRKVHYFFIWREVWGRGRHRGGLLKVNLPEWRVEREINWDKKEDIFGYESHLLPLPSDYPIFLFTLSGKLRIFNDALEEMRTLKVNYRNFSLKKKEFLRLPVWFIGKVSGLYLLIVKFIVQNDDPYLAFYLPKGYIILFLDRHFNLVDKVRLGEGEFPLLDLDHSIISLVKEGRIEVYRIAD